LKKLKLESGKLDEELHCYRVLKYNTEINRINSVIHQVLNEINQKNERFNLTDFVSYERKEKIKRKSIEIKKIH
jgi:hypothetical protein